MDLRRSSSLILIAFFLALLPGRAANAQSVEPPPTPAPVVIPTFDSIPALLAPVALRLPWSCGLCVAGQTAVELMPDPEVAWHDVGSWFNWLGAQLWNRVAYPVVCWMLSIAQAVLAEVQKVVNAVVIEGINNAWRLAILGLLWARAFWFSIWGAFEWIRSLVWSFWAWANAIQVQIAAAIRVAGELFKLLADVLGQLAGLIIAAAQGLVYFLGMFFALIPGTVTAILNPNAPPQLTGMESNFLFVMFRDSLQAIADSRLGWAWNGFIAIMYARFAFWLVAEMSELNS